MAIFQTQLYDKVRKKVMAIGSIEQMVQAYNMAKLTMGGDYEVQPHGCQKDGSAYTFDIVFVNNTDEVHMGLGTTLMECIRNLTENQGTKNGYFGKYAGQGPGGDLLHRGEGTGILLPRKMTRQWKRTQR